MLSSVLGFSEDMNHSYISVTEATFFPQAGVTVNLKQFDVLLDNKISIIRLYLFFSFCFFFAAEQSWPKRVVVLLDPSIILRKKSEARRSKYL